MKELAMREFKEFAIGGGLLVGGGIGTVIDIARGYIPSGEGWEIVAIVATLMGIAFSSSGWGLRNEMIKTIDKIRSQE